MTTYAFIINYNRLDLPRRMADYLADCSGITPVIVDNNSTYPPLLEYYNTTPHKVERLYSNMGPCAVWTAELPQKYGVDTHYIITDPDLIIDDVPRDFLHLLQTGLDRYPWAKKAGFSLEIDDLPDTPLNRLVVNHERGAWTKLDDQFYRAYVDTTFALVRGLIHDLIAIRTAKPYTARHAPWYYTRVEDIPADELYYIKTSHPVGNYWTKRIAESMGIPNRAHDDAEDKYV